MLIPLENATTYRGDADRQSRRPTFLICNYSSFSIIKLSWLINLACDHTTCRRIPTLQCSIGTVRKDLRLNILPVWPSCLVIKETKYYRVNQIRKKATNMLSKSTVFMPISVCMLSMLCQMHASVSYNVTCPEIPCMEGHIYVWSL